MTLQQAAQMALDVQDACNASGVILALANQALPALREHSQGTRSINKSPIIAMFLYKLGELNGCGISSLSEGYDAAEAACKAIAAGPVADDDSADPTSVEYRAPHSSMSPSAIEAIFAGKRVIR